jgi:hypothetical protein
MTEKLFQDKNKVVWVQLSDFNYPRTALYLPTRYRKEAMCEAHDSILGGLKSTNKKTPLAPLPIPERPNLWIHADLFGPMLTADNNKKFVLCITDAFTKYAVVTAIANKEAEMVVDAIYKDWFAKFGIPAHGWGKRIRQQTFSRTFPAFECPAHKNFTSTSTVQCASGSFKTIKKFLQSFVDDTTLNWETFLLALAISYNTSYHSTIATTPFEL